MSVQAIALPFKGILSGDRAFHSHTAYQSGVRQELTHPTHLPVSYTFDTESKIVRVVKRVFSIIFFPILIYQALHALLGKIFFLPASTPSVMGYDPNHAAKCRFAASVTGDWKYKRFTVAFDGHKIDALVMGKTATFGNGRWVLAANGNGGFYEDKFRERHDFKDLLTALNGNAVVFNYVGVGASPGFPNRDSMVKAYRAMLNLLEDKERGIGAREIIGWGHSIGGGVQGAALSGHTLKEGIKYAFINSRSFTSLSKTARGIIKIPGLGALVRLIGWDFDALSSSKKLKAPEIILQTARVEAWEELTDSKKIVHDEVIPVSASLAKALLDDKKMSRESKVIIGIPETHNESLQNIPFLAKKVEEALKL